MNHEFEKFGLHPQLVKAVDTQGYTTPTPIQTEVIPIMLTGQDVIGQAQTGTGKTAAFALPILHNLESGLNIPQSIILAPTRELAVQVAEAFEKYGQFQNVRVLPIYGGQPYGAQLHALKRGVDIIVGTPGRMLDLIGKRKINLTGVTSVVLDEADEMLSMGFIEDIEAILSEVPDRQQTTLFSATMPPAIRRLADRYMNSPKIILIENKQRTVEAIEQRYYLVNEEDKPAAMARLFEMETINSALVFARTRAGTGALANELNQRGFPAEPLNGDMSQEARENVLSRFRDNMIKVLVATDIAARGLDIDHISHVFNYDVPQFPEIYVHRVGRTGRAGKSGTAITLITPREQHRLKKIEKYSRQKIQAATLPTVDEIISYRDTQLLERMLVWLKRGRTKKELMVVDKLEAAGYDSRQIAAAALKLSRAEEKRRPIEAVSPIRTRVNGRKRERGPGRLNKMGAKRFKSKISHEKGMIRLSLDVGKDHGLRPADVVGTIAFHADIPGRTIGAIKILDQHTLVDVPEMSVSKVLAKNGNYKVRRRLVTVKRAN